MCGSSVAFRGASILISTVAAVIRVPTRSACAFSHTQTNTCVIRSFSLSRSDQGKEWLQIHFNLYLLDGYRYWTFYKNISQPLVFCLWRILINYMSYFFNWIGFLTFSFFEFFIYCRLTVCQRCSWYFSHSVDCLFSSVIVYFVEQRLFSVRSSIYPLQVLKPVLPEYCLKHLFLVL